MAQSPPQAECPHKQAGGECPQPEQPMAEEGQPPAQQPPPAQEPMGQEAPPPAYTSVTVTEEEEQESTLERYGIALSLGGGVAGFTNDTLRDTTDDGGAWNVRAAFGTRFPVAFEAEYIGSAQSIDALGLDDDAVLVGNGLQGAARVNILDYNIQPFVFGGLAWRHYELANEDFNTSDIADSDDVMEIPLGAGVAWKYRGLVIDVRGEYRYTTFEDMVPEFIETGIPSDTDGATMNRYGAYGTIGYAF